MPSILVGGVTYTLPPDDSQAQKIPQINAALIALAAQLNPNLGLTLISFWKLDEASGTRADSFGANNLADNNTVTQATGKIGNAAQFTIANSEYLSIADNVSLSTGDIDFSMCAWVYSDSFGAHRFIISKSDGSTVGEYALLYNTTVSRFRFFIQNGATLVTVDANALGAPSTATWYFIVAWHDAVANTVNIQVNNGSIDSATTGATVPSDSAQPFYIGALAGPASYWNGRIDAVGFWKRALTGAERAALYNAGAGREYPF